MTMNNNSAYVPGVCNINHAEIAYRKKAGYFGLVAFVAVFIFLLILNLNSWFRIILFLPAFIAACGYFQAKNKFCAAYGSSGRQNAQEGESEAKTVSDKTALLRDKIKSRSIYLQSALVAMAITLLALVV